MKPTEEIIDLSRQLHGLKVRKKVECGDWYAILDSGNVHLAAPINISLITQYNHFVIPPLEWCLEWLRGRIGPVSLVAHTHQMEWGVYWKGRKEVEVNLPSHVAVLKAMVEVRKTQKEEQ